MKAELHSAGRVDWVDAAKGICIIFVVMMHSTLGLSARLGEEGFMHWVVAFAKPFRMPDFFLISGLFLARVIDRDWRTYLDRKLVHYAYFYFLWVTIQFAFKAPYFISEYGAQGAVGQYFLTFIQPFGTLWFIYELALFFVLAKLLHELNVSWKIVLPIAAILQMLDVFTGSVIIDQFCARFVYFYAGYIFAAHWFKIASYARDHAPWAVAGLVAWALVNGALVFSGWGDAPGVSLALGVLGALAIINISAVLTKAGLARPLQYCGENSIVIYLAFFIPMAVTRQILMRTGVITDVGVMALIVTIVAVIGPLVLWWFVQRTGYGRFLFIRPKWAWIAAEKTAAASPAKPSAH